MKEERTFAHQSVHYRYLYWPSRKSADTAAHPVVLLHGFAQSAASWEGVASRLSANRCVYALDFVGHGSSDRPLVGQPYTLEVQAQALRAFLVHLAAEEATPVVVGYSMGGRIALAAAMQNASAFAGLALESTGLGPETEAAQLAALERDRHAAACLRTEGLVAFMDDWQQLSLFASQKNLPVEAQERVRSGRLANSEEALARTFEGAGQHTMPARNHVLAALRTFDFPLLYLAGSLDAKYLNIAAAFAGIPRATVQVIQGAGHNTHLEKLDEFTSILEIHLSSWEKQ